MTILTLRADKPEAEIGLYDGQQQLVCETWQAHRQLSETIHSKIDKLLSSQKKKLSDVQGIVAFQGPGSFTGLRIGLSATNALAYGLGVPIVATQGKDWIEIGITQLLNGKSDKIAEPEYGAPARTTTQKK